MDAGLYVEGHLQAEGAPDRQQRNRALHTKPGMLPHTRQQRRSIKRSSTRKLKGPS